MKKLLLIPMLVLFGATASADHYDGDPDMEQSILNDHGPGSTSQVTERGMGDEYGSVLIDDLPPTAAGREAVHEKGDNDEYGSILLDVLRSDR